jgi:hypothetical protein
MSRAEAPLVDRLPEGLRRIPCVSCAGIDASPARVQRYAGLYDFPTLSYWRTRYEPSLRWNLDRVVVGTLTPEEDRAVAGVSLRLPIRHEDDPFAYFVSGAPPAITVSVSSIKFLDDVSTALAWLHRHGCSTEPIAWYASVLKYRQPGEFPDRRYPLPLAALGIPENALADAAVDQSAQKLLKTAVLFMLAHEIGHILHRHSRSGHAISGADWQAHELAADRFAIRVFRQSGTLPIGILPFFLTAAHLVPHRADFASEELWTDYLEARVAHPFTSHRLRSLAEELRRAPEEFAKHESNRGRATQRVQSVADQIDGIAPLLEDPERQRRAAGIGRAIPISELRPRKRGSTWTPAG